MAIIKCPECGRQISDKAPTCPNCGVEIANKIIKCPQCGEVYFNNQEVCPNCHHLTYPSREAQQPTQPVRHEPQPETPKEPVVAAVPPPTPGNNNPQAPNPQPKRKHTAFWVSLFLALVICGVTLYFYQNAKKTKEQAAYEFAIKSNDPLVLQTYLDNNLDATQIHRDSVMAKLEFLKKQDNDWSNAIVSGSKTALQDYLANHPNSEHQAEAKNMIDSLDWIDAKMENTEIAMQLYLEQHPNGDYVDEANDIIKKIKANTVQSEERSLVQGSLRKFFQSINARDEAGLESSVAPILSNFLGKANATRGDVLTFMNKIYKDDITNMNWILNNDYKIEKKEVGDELYEYTVKFSSIQKVERKEQDKPVDTKFQIKATLNPDGLISAMSMTKILE